MDVTKALEAEQGFLVENGPFYTGGTASPVGLDLPTGTFYLQTTGSGVLIFRKFGVNATDWRQLSAQDIPFDVSTLIDNSPDLTGLTQVQETIGALARRDFGKLYASASQDPNVTSTGTVVEAVSTAGVNVAESGAFTFRAQWSFRQVNSKSNTNGLAEILWRSDQQPGGLALDQNVSAGTSFSLLGNGNGEQTVGFGSFTATGPQTNIELYATIERVAGNGAARINSIRLDLWRLD